MEDKTLQILKQIEGLQTVETVAQALNLKRQSALNLLSKLKKQKYVTVQGGGKQVRFYRITTTKQLPRDPGMFDIINKHSPMKINPWYDHQVHGKYTVEDALLDALQTESFRVILASMHLFRHVTDWPKLYRSKDWQKVGALYDVARLFMRVNKMPERYRKYTPSRWVQLTLLKKLNFPDVAKKWRVFIPFNPIDVREAL